MRHHIQSAPALVALLLLATAGTAMAQFGTQVRPGDSDYVPVTNRASLAVAGRVLEADLGEPGVVTDNCILLDTATAPTAGAQREDIRLTPCLGQPVGSLVADTDVVERRNPYPIVAAANVQYVDLNGNGKYDKGDPVYITTAPAPGLATSTATGAWTLRLTPVGDFSAGTFVLAGDQDFAKHRGATASLNRLQLVRVDPKAWYLAPTGGTEAAPTPLPQFSLLPENSLRLAGAFGGKPDVRVANLSVAPASPVAGEAFQATLEVVNSGSATGAGLVVTKLDGQTVDARASPSLEPKARASLVVTLLAPRAAKATVAAGDLVRELVVAPPAAVPLAAPAAPPAADASLALRLSELEAEARGLKAGLEVAREDLAEARAELAALRGDSPLRTSSLGGEARNTPFPGPAAPLRPPRGRGAAARPAGCLKSHRSGDSRATGESRHRTLERPHHPETKERPTCESIPRWPLRCSWQRSPAAPAPRPSETAATPPRAAA